VIGRTLAHYRITAAIGAGGMGEVYRATDTKLGRDDVALKVLPAKMASDPERLDRFVPTDLSSRTYLHRGSGNDQARAS
jgi:serine/threonine protein kinase